MTAEPTLSRARLRDLAGLKSRKGRELLGRQLLEGPRLVREALAAGRVLEIFVSGEEPEARWRAAAPGIPVHRIPARDLERLADVQAPQEVLAIGPLLRPEPLADLLSTAGRILHLEGVQDPGNAGTLVRTAAALGLDACVFGPETADAASPKVLRASAGALFRIRVGHIPPEESLPAALRASGHRLVVPVVAGGQDVRGVKAPPRYVLVAGNEGAGSALAGTPDALRVTVPMAPGIESLNVAAACAVILGRWLA